MSLRVRELQDFGWGWYIVPLSQNCVALIDAADAAEIGKYNWCVERARNSVYAKRRAPDGSKIYMHRWLLGADDSFEVDHKNGDGLDNRRENLRLSTRAENGRNMRLRSNNTSGFKGACWDKSKERWMASIMINYRSRFLGYFDSAEEAHAAYCAAAKRLYGEFARTA